MSSSTRGLIMAVGAGLALAAGPVLAAASPADSLAARGKAIVQRDCAACHAIGPSGASPLKAAPPFRDLHRRYDLDALSEALAEGILVGHSPMPVRSYAPADVAAIIAYMKSLAPTLAGLGAR